MTEKGKAYRKPKQSNHRQPARHQAVARHQHVRSHPIRMGAARLVLKVRKKKLKTQVSKKGCEALLLSAVLSSPIHHRPCLNRQFLDQQRLATKKIDQEGIAVITVEARLMSTAVTLIVIRRVVQYILNHRLMLMRAITDRRMLPSVIVTIIVTCVIQHSLMIVLIDRVIIGGRVILVCGQNHHVPEMEVNEIQAIEISHILPPPQGSRVVGGSSLEAPVPRGAVEVGHAHEWVATLQNFSRAWPAPTSKAVRVSGVTLPPPSWQK